LRSLEKVCKASGLDPQQLVELGDKEAKAIIKRVSQEKLQSGHAAMARRIQIAMKGFFEANDRELRFRKVERIKVPAKKVSVEVIPDKIQAYNMADVSRSLRNRSIILCAFQSGVRIGCLCKWRYGHVKDQLYPEIKVPVRIKVTSDMDSKIAGYGLSYYYAFLAAEGAQALKDYIEERKRKGWVPKDDDPIFVTEGTASRGEQLTPQHVWEIVKNAAEKASFKREAVWTHVLRKTFRKVLNGTPIDEDTKETLMGHKLPGSRGSYFDYHDVDEVAEKYMKVEWGRTPETRIEKQLREAREEIETLKAELGREDLRKHIERLEGALRTALMGGFEKSLTEEAVEEILKGEGLAERIKKKHPEWISEG
jgi:integrase